MRRGLVLIFLAALTGMASSQNFKNAPSADFDPKPWIEDFQQILAEMSSHYADLEWAVENRKMDLPRLRRDTKAQLRDAADEDGARRILDKVVATFGDGHLEIRWPKSGSSPDRAVDAPNGVCARMGYGSTLHPGLDFSGIPGFLRWGRQKRSYFPVGSFG